MAANAPLYRVSPMTATQTTPFKPIGALEEEDFLKAHCRRCAKDRFSVETLKGGCQLLARWMVHPKAHRDYPKEMVMHPGEEGHCTAFVIKPELARCRNTVEMFPESED